LSGLLYLCSAGIDDLSAGSVAMRRLPLKGEAAVEAISARNSCHRGLRSAFRHKHLAAQGFRRSLAQHLPGSGGVALADLREHAPEVVAAAGLHVRGGHVQLRPLVCDRGRSRGEAALVGGNFSGQAILRQLHGVRALGSEELVDVARQHVGVRQHRVISRVVFSSGGNHRVRVLQLLLHALEVLQSLGGLTRLSKQGILDDTGITVQQCRGFSAEVLEDLKAFAADVLQILVAGGCGRRAAVARRLCRNRLGIGLRLWER